MGHHLRACWCSAALVAFTLIACGNDTKPSDNNGSAGASGSAAGNAGLGNYSTLESVQWPMPNSADLGLPHPAEYDADTTAGVVHDLVTKLDWLQDPGTELYPRAEALSHCDELSFAGFDDWRAPTFIELVSLFDEVPNDADPQDPIYIPPVFAAEGRFWTTAPPTDTGLGRLVDFTAAGCSSSSFCSIGVLGKAADPLGGAFCVRNEQPPATTVRFQPNADYVIDWRTGLIWQNVPGADQTSDHETAASTCQALGNGARLPTVKELLSILVPLLDKNAFPGWPSDAFAWSSSAIPNKPDTFWVAAITGATSAEPSTSHLRVQCVH